MSQVVDLILFYALSISVGCIPYFWDRSLDPKLHGDLLPPILHSFFSFKFKKNK